MPSFEPSALAFNVDLEDEDDDGNVSEDGDVVLQVQQAKSIAAAQAEKLVAAVKTAELCTGQASGVTASSSSISNRSLGSDEAALNTKSKASKVRGRTSPSVALVVELQDDVQEEGLPPLKKKRRKSPKPQDGDGIAAQSKSIEDQMVTNGKVKDIIVATAQTKPPALKIPAEKSLDVIDIMSDASSDAGSEGSVVMKQLSFEEVEEKLSFLQFDEAGNCIAGSGLQYFTHEKQQLIQQYTQLIPGNHGDRLMCYEHKKVRMAGHLVRGADGFYRCTEASMCTNTQSGKGGKGAKGRGEGRTTSRYHAPLYCANCNMPGHLPRECPMPRRSNERVCFICASNEHADMRDCPNTMRDRQFHDDLAAGILTPQPCIPSDVAMMTCFICFQKGHCDCSEPASPHQYLGHRQSAGRCSVCAGPHHLRDCGAIKELMGSQPVRNAAPVIPNRSPPPRGPYTSPSTPRPPFTPITPSVNSVSPPYRVTPPRPPTASPPLQPNGSRPLHPTSPLTPRSQVIDKPSFQAPSPSNWSGSQDRSTPIRPPPYSPRPTGPPQLLVPQRPLPSSASGPRLVPRTYRLAPQQVSGRFSRS